MFTIGNVIRLYDDRVDPPSIKYSIIVGGNSDEVVTVFINTEIYYWDLPTELQALSYPVTPEICPYLQRESFVDCSEIKPIKKSKLNNILTREPGRKEKRIPQKQLHDILGIIKRAKTITRDEKEIYKII